MKLRVCLTQLILIVALAGCKQGFDYTVLLYDCDHTATQRLFHSNKLLFVFPNDSDSALYKEQTSLWVNNLTQYGIECTIKYENQLMEEDFLDPMFVFGVVNSFQNWEQFITPITKLNNGFSFGRYDFKNESDAILYIPDSTDKIMKFVVVGNSISSLRPITNDLQDGYNYLVYEEGMITHFGNTTNNEYDKSKHVYLPDIKHNHYKKSKTKYYDFYVSLPLDELGMDYMSKLDSFDLFVEKYLEVMELDKPKDKITCYIHFDNEEISYISTHFSHLCGGTTYGIVTGNEIHSLGFEGSIAHESAHIIFNSKFNNYAPTFFSEGIRQYYDYATDPDMLNDGLNTAREFIDEDISTVIIGVQDFFQGQKYYKISGVFVKYLLELSGLDTYKQFYSRISTPDSIEENLLNSYSVNLETCINNYRVWLQKQSY